MLRWRARRGLSRVMVKGIKHLRRWEQGGEASGPLILVANHSSWWDAVLPVVLSLHTLRLDALGLMDAVQLRRYRFFRRVGLLPVDRSDPRRALLSLDLVAEELRGRRRVLWLFPQGKLLPAEVRPLGCEPGAAWLVRRLDGCFVAPVAFRYEPCADPRPEAWLTIGELVWMESDDLRATTATVEKMITGLLDTLRLEIASGSVEGFGELSV